MEKNVKYYDGNRCLNKKDINGNEPLVRIVVSNRSDGKTTFFNKYMTNKALKNPNWEFMLIYRYNYEICDIATKFFGSINHWFPDIEVAEKRFCSGKFIELYFDENLVGYAVSLNAYDTVKKYSHVFNNVKMMLFDEFQTEDDRYLPDEISKLKSIHTSVARGVGEQVRNVPIVLCSNNITLCNPYFLSMGITERLQENTHFLRGNGWVLEMNFNESVARQQKEKGLSNIFPDEYDNITMTKKALRDSNNFISRIDGNSYYLCGFKISSEFYSAHTNNVEILIKKNYDSGQRCYACTPSDHDFGLKYINYDVIYLLKKVYEEGNIRFQNLQCKSAFFKIINSNINSLKIF